jgi:hypothetical protein
MLALARVLSTVALFAIRHPRAVKVIMFALAVGIVGLATAGAVSLIMWPSWPKVLCFAAVAVAAWLAITAVRR